MYQDKDPSAPLLSGVGPSNSRKEELDAREEQINQREEQMQALIDEMISKEKLLRDAVAQAKSTKRNSVSATKNASPNKS